MKLNLLSKTKSSKLSFTFSTFICAILFLFFGNANAQIVETFTSPTATSLNATAWAANTAYVVNQYVHSVDMASGTAVNRLYKVIAAGTSNTTAPIGLTDTSVATTVCGAGFSYMGLMPLSSLTWTCPTGVTSIQVECWGGGGAGGSASAATSTTPARSGGGGGAGSYVKKTIAVVPGIVYNLVVGLGGYKGGTSFASGYYGNLGGKSEFSGGSVTALTASGGTGGTGAGLGNLNTNSGGVLGGVYGFSLSGTQTTAYTSSSVVTLTGGGGLGVTTAFNTSSSAITYIAATNQGSGYTSNPSVSVSPGVGQTFLAYANPNINSSGAETTTLGSNGGASSATSGGSGGANPDGLAGGAGGTGIVHGSFVGTTAVNAGSGGGGGFSFWTTGTGASAAGGAGANGKIVITYTAPITTYTYDGSGDLNDVTNWADGSNNRPANFTADFQIFKINSNVTTTAPWTVSGAASKVVVGDSSTTNVSLTIASGFGITATMDVTNGNKVFIQDIYSVNSTATPPVTSFYMNHPTFGTLGDTSEVHYQNTTINNALVKTAFTYGKLYVDGIGTGTVFFSGATNPTNHIVKTLFEVAAGSNAYFSEISYYYMTLNTGAQATISGTLKTGKVAGFVSSNLGTASSASGSLQFIGAESLTLGANSTIEYNRESSGTTQIVTPRTDYKNLTLSGLDNNKSFTGATTISGNLNLNITGTSTSTLAANVTVNGALNFTAGKVTTATNALTLGTSGTISGAGATTGWVIGNLIKQTASNASPSFNFAIGDATNYTPISVTFTGVNSASATGSITATTTAVDHPQLATSDLDATKSVNRTWNLLNNGVSGFTNYTVNLNYSAAETDATATPASFVIRKYDALALAWTSPTTTATPSATSASATGLVGFGDFAVGEISAMSTTNFELDSIKIIPNPSTSNFVTITSSLNEDIDIEVYDIFGKHILSQKVIYNILDVSDLHSGMYLLKISQKEKTTIKKLIVK